jgi:hypothetical protein
VIRCGHIIDRFTEIPQGIRKEEHQVATGGATVRTGLVIIRIEESIASVEPGGDGSRHLSRPL